MSMTRLQLEYAIQNALDATGLDTIVSATTSVPRFGSSAVLQVADNVFAEEWSNILDANQTYRFNSASTTTDSNGQVAVSALTTGSGDTAKNFYRVLSGPTDGNVLYRETDYRNVPIATLSNYQAPWDYLYYLAGANFQMLPVQSGLTLTWFVSWTPTTISGLAADSSTIDFPTGYESLLAWQTASKMLAGKGGAQGERAGTLAQLADGARKNLLAGVGRLTTRPNFMMFQDLASHWGGG